MHIRIAQVWSGILGHTVRPVDVPLMMAGMKLVRAQNTPDYSDNVDDIDGYIEIARKVVGEDMILARSVQEYLDKKFPGEILFDFNQVALPIDLKPGDSFGMTMTQTFSSD